MSSPTAPTAAEDVQQPLIQPGMPALILFDDWTVNPLTGRNVRGAFGPVTVVRAEALLGFAPKNPSTNWYLQIGDGDDVFIVAGCRVHFASPQAEWRQCWAGDIARFDGAAS